MFTMGQVDVMVVVLPLRLSGYGVEATAANYIHGSVFGINPIIVSLVSLRHMMGSSEAVNVASKAVVVVVMGNGDRQSSVSSSS